MGLHIVGAHQVTHQPLTFALGKAFQFDWSEEGPLIFGLFRRIQIYHMKLRASRAF
ncbi:hypothetical protein V466_00275 [Pseudomonas mandelii PD30]|uniref:Uncharacterized protein n=1 Tax=Pseudomonas mandelii PD30 TaxID=1419583 RepID=A0A059LAX5_9PSED|nr:hypothetical protein V466_00275 [Pseudomonas mandelii PD30]